MDGMGKAGHGRPDARAVMDAELEVILGDVDAAARGEARRALWGLALSGGGIRSATFAIGVMQALARQRLLGSFHYLSSVSGGGYASAFVQALVRRCGLQGVTAFLQAGAEDDRELPEGPGLARNRPLRHLREYSNYLSPRKSVLSGDTLGMAGTYLRNVLLTQMQLFALMLVMGLLPLALAPALIGLAGHTLPALLLAAGMAVLASGALAALCAAAWRHEPTVAERPPLRLSFTSAAVVLLLTGACLLGAQVLAQSPALPMAPLPWLGAPDPSRAAAWFVGQAAAVYALTWTVWFFIDLRVCRRRGVTSDLQAHRFVFLTGTLAASVLAGLVLLGLHRVLSRLDGDPWLPMVLGTPMLFLGIATVAVVQLGLVGPALSDLQREVWARVGGKTGAAVLLGVTASLGLLLLGPWLAFELLRSTGAWANAAGVGGVVSWLAVTLGGVLGAIKGLGAAAPGQGPGRRLARLLVLAAPWVFILGLWVGIGVLSQWLLQLAGAGPMPARAAVRLGDYLHALATLALGHWPTVACVLLAALAVWLVLALRTDANELSLNAFYRNRLVRCYLGASHAGRSPEPTTNFDPRDDIELHDLDHTDGGQRPLYPLVCAAMNLVRTKQLDWQDRRAASFVMSPRYCGHLPPPGREGAESAGDAQVEPHPQALARSIRLGTAIAVSGAAVSPNMGARSTPALTFLLTLFDARLGWWLPNRPRQRIGSHTFYSERPHFPGLHLLAEALGLTHDAGRFVHVSDGGHFENLALYELVRRGCRFILCSDAGADPGRAFADLGNALHKCRVDFGVEIDIDISELRPDPATGLSRRHAAMGKVRYPDGGSGLLLYLKPGLVGNEPADIQHYARANPGFPHQSTLDQYFDEAQFECYRRLGEHVASTVLGPALERIADDPGRTDLPLENSEAKERLVMELLHRFHDPASGATVGSGRHADALAGFLATLRTRGDLAPLDGQLHPGLGGLSGGARLAPTELPRGSDFRPCFYFCQELIQFIAGVYVDLRLETTWSHPDNRGWINRFRQWARVPVFRVAWVLGVQNHGAAFVGFCEQRLGLPRIHDALRVERITVDGPEALAARALELEQAGRINRLEAGILGSSALREGERVDAVHLLRLRWSLVLPDASGMPEGLLTLGIAATARNRLVLFRIRGHLRRIGLGGAFMRALMNTQAIARVALAAGHYGVLGVVRRSQAQRFEQRTRALFEDARRERRARTRVARRERSGQEPPRPA